MAENSPRISIGLPVYNGENYLEDAIKSVLAQTYTAFELIISDNASTDRTAEICRCYAAQDTRIRYYRNEQNRGAAWNYNRVFELAVGEFFEWLAHDDLIAPQFLEKCLAILDADASAVLSYPKVTIIDEQAQPLETYEVKLKTDSACPHQRFRELLRGHRCFEVFGLIRTGALRQTPLIGGFAHGDGVLLSRLCLFGRFIEIPEYLFFSRKHAQQSMYVYGVYDGGMPDYRKYAEWFDPAHTGKLSLPYWNLLTHYGGMVWTSTLSWQEKMRCLLSVATWARRMRRWLVYDMLLVARISPKVLPSRAK